MHTQPLAEYMQSLLDDPTLCIVPPKVAPEYTDRVESVFDCVDSETSSNTRAGRNPGDSLIEGIACQS